MPTPILMPALSPTMSEGNLVRWLKKEGETIDPGDVIAEIETDKATMEVEAVDEGRLGKILVAEGSEGIAVNAEIALLLLEGEEEGTLASYQSAPQGKGAVVEEVAASAAPVEESVVPGESIQGSKDADGRILASPLAKRIARTEKIDLMAVSGSGPNGRIVKRDVEEALAAAASSPPPIVQPTTTAPSSPPSSGVDAKELADKLGMRYEVTPHTMMRKTIARRLSESKQTVPHFYLSIECRIDKLLSLRQELNGSLEGDKISVNDFIISACAGALKKVPRANASWHEEGILSYSDCDIAVAVAIPDGLITPIVKQAQNKGLVTISREMKDYAARARAGALKPEEYIGGTFSLSNLGMFGIRDFSAVINPPHGCILAVGAGEQRVIVVKGEMTVATVMTCTLSVDHRVVDGAIGAEFLSAFKGLIETPMTMLL